MTKQTKHPSWRTSFLAIVRYELLWNIRKKKFIGVFILAFVFPTLTLALPLVVSTQPIQPNPDYVITNGTGLGGLGFFLFALVTVMNSISGEFESGSIIPLLTKPVSRTTVYLGKISAAFLTVLGAYIVLTVYMTAGGYLIYGPQNNLQLVIITLLGSIFSTLVWMAIVLAAGSLSKSSIVAAMLGIGVWFGLNIASGVISQLSDSAWIAAFFPGNGATGTIISMTPQSVSTGTDGIGSDLITYILNSTAIVQFHKIEFTGIGQGPGRITQVPTFTEPLLLIVARSVAVVAVYLGVQLHRLVCPKTNASNRIKIGL